MPEWLRELLLGGLGGGVVLVFLGKRVVDHFLQRRIDQHRDQLQEDREKQVEEFRFELGRLAHEHEIRFSSLHQHQVQVIGEVYAHLERLHTVVRLFAFGANDSGSLKSEMDQRFVDFQNYYYPNAIWLDRKLCDQINEVFDLLVLMRNEGKLARGGDHKWYNEVVKREKQIGELRKAVEKEFRRLLAVDQD